MTFSAGLAAGELPQVILTTYRNALPAVVRVDAVSIPGESHGEAQRFSGSGALIAEDGIVVTSLDIVRAGLPAETLLQRRDNGHQIPVEIIVTLSDGDRHNAELIGGDALSKLALLKIGAKTRTLPIAPVSDLHNGTVTLGFGGGIRSTPTLGLLGARRTARPIGEFDGTIMRTVSNVIANRDVGGPVIDLHGRMVGIVVGMGLDEDTGGAVESAFIVPAETVAWVAGALRRDGAVRWGYLGIALKAETPVVDTVKPGSPAETAGLSGGDRIVAADFFVAGANPKTIEFAHDDGLTFRQAITHCAPGSTVALHVERAGRRLPPISVELAERNADAKSNARAPR